MKHTQCSICNRNYSSLKYSTVLEIVASVGFKLNVQNALLQPCLVQYYYLVLLDH